MRAGNAPAPDVPTVLHLGARQVRCIHQEWVLRALLLSLPWRKSVLTDSAFST